MAKKNNNTLLLVAAVGVAGYFFWKRSGATAAPTAAPGSGLTPTLTGNQSAPTYGTGSAQTPMPSVANDARLTDINQWIGTLSATTAAAARNALAVMSQDEIAGLYDIVHNDFYGNGITSPAQRTFWDAWRVKYSVY